MGASMVGRLPDKRRQDRTQTGINDSRLRRRSESQASEKACCGTLASPESGKANADGDGDVRRVYRTFLRSKRVAQFEAIHAKAVSIHAQLPPQTRIRTQTSM